MLHSYFKALYGRTMNEAYSRAGNEIVACIKGGGKILDCGASSGDMFDELNKQTLLPVERYFGLEWDKDLASQGQQRGLNINCGDLNKSLPFGDDTFACVYGLSVLEHLLQGCKFLRESHRVLEKGGKLILLTPNISTYFTAALILFGKMPSSGPHPDSDALLKKEVIFKVSSDLVQHDAESDTPVHRHLVVFSFLVLRDYLKMLGFSDVRGYGYGLYPFPNFLQPLLEKVDPYHCHQMVFIAEK